MNFTRFFVAALAGILVGCGSTAHQAESITLATTTSVQDTGLLDVLRPLFKNQTGIEVKVVAVGTGQAFEIARHGDADVLIVHDRAGEDEFVAQGHGIDRRDLMHNDFVIVGPAHDPASIKGMKSAVEAFKKIADAQTIFVSRGDDSGTHRKEKVLWKKTGLENKGKWYLEAGTGMGATLRMANEKMAYTLSDRGTFLAQGKPLDLAILVEGDPLLINHYAVIRVNPEKHPGINQEGAREFADFLMSKETLAIIGQFGVEQFGQPLFTPVKGR